MLLKVAASEKGDAAGFDFEVLYIYLVATPDAHSAEYSVVPPVPCNTKSIAKEC